MRNAPNHSSCPKSAINSLPFRVQDREPTFATRTGGMTLAIPGGTVLSVVIGSHAYGLETEDSDVDRRGV
ncbi:hypothetical protein Mro02_52920 [Microbispora rosea subsp. aerata]|nr:hypothetical protein Mro02_52920 [Microbispora rosea subsp. aerata]GLJ84049.1 hypothetical protein GCM10017588_27770 [Microbispora rosea subsp. aerata]